ncbi:MAG: CDP-alcohol phosphatidyltransferase family protein [Verrucomicrobiae bacterium]|nr:CDP-alcohol phosphatidyltransferase family protein [Verrucomicrobiae bacterium]MDW8344974.1 CDP-alcohol phosphatidyltransferase family protein [Verrucomicrobiae bacterium]
MTLANKITILRILLIPVFVWVTLDYAVRFQAGHVREWQPVLAFVIFAVAALSDGLDGYIARRYNQRTELGTWLDPLADKALLISALVILSIDHGGAFEQLPLWFPILVISRDVILLSGTMLLHFFTGHVTVRPRWVGKCATFFQMLTLGWVLLQIQQPPFHWPMLAAGIFTFASGMWYIYDGVRQLTAHESKTR